jgi:hypothetical protein
MVPAVAVVVAAAADTSMQPVMVQAADTLEDRQADHQGGTSALCVDLVHAFTITWLPRPNVVQLTMVPLVVAVQAVAVQAVRCIARTMAAQVAGHRVADRQAEPATQHATPDHPVAAAITAVPQAVSATLPLQSTATVAQVAAAASARH